MNNALKRTGYYIVTQCLQVDQETVSISKTLILVLILQRALLEMSYVCEDDRNTIQYILSLLARPQLIMSTVQVGYVSAICSIGFVFGTLLKLPGQMYLGLYLQIFRCNVFNFLFELSQSYIGYFSKFALSLIYLVDVVIIQGTLNIDTKNLQITRNNSLNQIGCIGNLIMIIMNLQEVSRFTIIIVAIINSTFQLASHCLYSPYKSVKLTIIISSIYTVTLYTAIINYIGQQNNFNTELVMFPFIFRLLHTQITRKNTKLRITIPQIMYDFEENKYNSYSIIQPRSISEQIIYSSILIIQKQYYNAWTILWTLKCNNILQQFKIKQIKQLCLHLMQNNLLCNLIQHTNMHEAVQMLMESENQNIKIQQKIINILREKIHIHQQLLDDNDTIQFKRLLNFTNKLLEIQKILEQQYDNYPCNKTQNILGFYYSEIMNDLMQANKLFSIQTISDEKMKKKGIIQDTFSSKMIYLITTYSSKGLITLRTSNNASQILEIQNEQLINRNLNFLIPSGVVEWHDKIIQQFIDTGNSKYLRKSNENYYQRYSDGYIQAIDFAIDVSFITELNFIAFIQPSATEPFLMILNQKLEITSFTKHLIQQIGVSDQTLHKQKIYKFIPKFDSERNYIENVEVSFQSHNQNQCCLQTSIQIQRRILDNINAYYILSFDYFRKITGQSLNSAVQSINSPEREQIMKKQEFEISLMEELQSLKADESIQIDEPYEINYEYQEEGQKQSPQIEFQIEAQKISYLDATQKDDNFLYSPNYNQQKLIQSQSQSMSQPQLKKPLFFAKICKEKMSVQDEDNQNSPKKRKQLQLVYEDNQIDDGASQVSSLMGVRKSKYFKKYEILTKIQDLQSNSKSHKIFISVFLLSLSIQIILGIVQIVQININLNNLVSDIDLLQIKNLVYQPLESFLVTRWTLVNYNTLRATNQITITKYNEIIKYPRSNLALGYDALASNVYQVLNRKELQNFLLDTQLSMYQYIDSNKGEIFSMTLRNAINVLLNYQYILKMAYQIEGNVVSDSPQVYFPYRNYKPLKISFSELNESVLKNTQDRATKMLYQSGILFYLSISSLILFFVGNYVNLLLIFMKYRKYLKIIIDNGKDHFEFDILSNKNLLDQVQKDQNKLFKFQFYLDNYEKLIDSYGDTDESRKRKKNKKNHSISTLFWLTIFLIISAIIAAHTIATYEQTKQYLTKYSDTCIFYKQVSDIGTDIPTMYAQREILYGRQFFIYLNSSDFQGILQEVKDGLIRTHSFNSYDQDFNKLLLSDNFRTYYENIQNSNLCPYLPMEIQEKSLTICSQSMSGNMQRGLRPILIYIINFIQTDMEINQFIKRNNAPFMELEGAFLVSEVIKQINKNFNNDLQEQTQKLLFEINTYNVSIQIFLFLVLIMTFTRIKYHLIRQYYLVQRLLYLIPRKTLFSDDLFERNVRTVLMSDSIN